MLRKPSVAATNLTGFLVGLAMFASFLIFPQFAQAPESTGYGFGLSVTAAGLVMMPTALAQLGAGPIAAKLADRIGFRAMLSLGTVLITLSFLINTFAHYHVWELVFAGILIGAGITFAFAASANLIVEAVPQGEVGIATGINTVMRTVGGSFGAAAVTAILTASTIPPTEGAYTMAFAFSAVAGVLALVASRLVPRPRADAARARDRVMELGIYTFGELTDPALTVQQRMADLLEEIELADQVGLDVFGVGEHHRPEFTVSAPAVILAAAAARDLADPAHRAPSR